jgi:hypothetical protein
MTEFDELIESLKTESIFGTLREDLLRKFVADDPNWPDRFREIHAEKARREKIANARLIEVMKLLSSELEAAGLLTRTDMIPWGFVTEENTNEAFPILLKWYARITDDEARDYISFRFYSYSAANWVPEMIALFRTLRGEPELYATARIGDSVMRYGGPAYLDDYIEFASDTGYGQNRRFFITDLWKYKKDPRVLPLLINVANHDDDFVIVRETLYALRRIGDPSTRYIFERYLEHPDADARKIARAGIAKIDKQIARSNKGTS